MPDSPSELDGPRARVLQETCTRFLHSAVDGDAAAVDSLFSLVYDELRILAAGHLRDERVGHTLQPTALVHEVFEKLIVVSNFEFQGRAQFLALASRAMRRVLVDHARGLARLKRGGGWQRVDLEHAGSMPVEDLPDLVELDRTLSLLSEHSERQAKIVELRFFGGLEFEMISVALQISKSTVEREWRVARAWLAYNLERGGAG